LHECLVTVATLLAPFTPFVAEELWRNLAAGRDGRPDSVHLADYPFADDRAIDAPLEDAMAGARAIVALGRTIRADTKTKVRQPLREAIVHYPGDHDTVRPLLDLVADELNVKEVVFAESAERFGRWHAKPNFKVLGPRLGGSVKDVATALVDNDDAAAGLARGERVTVATASGPIELAPDDVDLTQEVLEGWGVASDAGITVALDLELSPDRKLEGLAREVVRAVQDARRAAGLDVSDRIALGVAAAGEVAAALERHRGAIAAETLATEMIDVAQPGLTMTTVEIEGEPVTIALRKL
jgi:isoleucyl-tRNA synthetase